MMEWERRGFFDASAYMLFEASGDSDQAGYSDGALLSPYSDAAEDDAQSCCSYGKSDVHAVSGHAPPDGGEGNRPDFDDYCNGEEDEGKEEEEEEEAWWSGGCDEEEGVVDQCRGGRKPPPTESNSVVARGNSEKLKKSSKANCEEAMNEREGDKLFWETCLAS